jgi:hypothetical protein
VWRFGRRPGSGGGLPDLAQRTTLFAESSVLCMVVPRTFRRGPEKDSAGFYSAARDGGVDPR